MGRYPPNPYDLLDALPLLDGECSGCEGGSGQGGEGVEGVDWDVSQ